MALKIITVGDATDHRGEVVGGSPTHKIGGRAIARVGDFVICPEHYADGRPHGMNEIVEGHSTFSVDDKAVAVEGCRTVCGCRLIGSATATVD